MSSVEIDLENLVLDLVFNSLNVQVLLRCRCVCRKWNELALSHLNSQIERIRIVFKVIKSPNRSQQLLNVFKHLFLLPSSSPSSSEGFGYGGERFGEPELSLLPEFMRYLSSPSHLTSQITFTNFTFHNIILYRRLVMDFFTEYGHNINILQLDFQDRPYEMLMIDEKSFTHIINQCSNLIQLDLCGVRELELRMICSVLYAQSFKTNITKLKVHLLDCGGESLQIFITKMLVICPLLNDLSVQAWFDSPIYLSPLIMPRTHQNLRNLTVASFPQEYLPLLDSLRLRLLKFHTLYLNMEKIEELTEFLESQSGSLECLRIWHLVSRNNFHRRQAPFPVMPKLKLLRIGFPSHAVDEQEDLISFAPIDFTRQFPSLEIFVLSGNSRNCNMNTLLADSNSQVHNNLRLLQLPSGLNGEELSRAKQLFPQVKDLTIEVTSNESFPALWSTWKNLEFLFLTINRNEAPKNTSLDELFAGLEARAKKCCIGNLKQLKELTIKINNEKEQNTLTNSTLMTITKLPSLEFIRIAGIHNVTKDGLDEICNNLPHLNKAIQDGTIILESNQNETPFKPYPLQNDEERNLFICGINGPTRPRKL